MTSPKGQDERSAPKAERQEFEAWAKPRSFLLDWDDERNMYSFVATDYAWNIWQAARASRSTAKTDALLEKYGTHLIWCENHTKGLPHCNCGWYEAVQSAVAEVRSTGEGLLRPLLEGIELALTSHLSAEEAQRAIFCIRAAVKNRGELASMLARPAE